MATRNSDKQSVLRDSEQLVKGALQAGAPLSDINRQGAAAYMYPHVEEHIFSLVKKVELTFQ
jgi:hypothetical protein